MTGRQQWAVVGAIVALLGIGAYTATRLLEDELTSISVGSDAPGFTAFTVPASVNEQSIAKTLSDYRGDVVLLNIWATWCEPCRREMPSIEAVHKRLGPKGLRVVAVSVDQPGQAAAIRDFFRDYNLTFEALHDSAGVIQAIYRTTGVPETFIIARDGTIRKKWISEADWNSEGNVRLLESLLAEPRP